jgi:putative photosynthetic complex assembly protein
MNSSVIPTVQASRGAPAPVLGAAFLVVATLVAVTGLRIWQVQGPASQATPPKARAAVIAERVLRFEDRPNGAVAVIDVQHPERSQLLPPGVETDGFLRATLRALASERKLQGDGDHQPFRLSALADGRLVLQDLATGHDVDLEAFGHTNAGRFAALLTGSAVPAPPAPKS